jgi:hypothetical protein
VAYVLSSKPGTPTAVFATVGAQHDPEKSLARAIRQASLLDVPLACATNGHDIVEHFSSSRRTVRIKLPSSPTRAWRAYMRLHGLSPDGGHLIGRDYDRSLLPGRKSDRRLRYYQVVAMNRALAAYSRDEGKALLHLAPGTGTTLTSMALISKLVNYRLKYHEGKPFGIVYLDNRSQFTTPYGPAGTTVKFGKDDEISLTIASLDTPVAKLPKPAETDFLVMNLSHGGNTIDPDIWKKILSTYSKAFHLAIIGVPQSQARPIYEYFGLAIYRYSAEQAKADHTLERDGTPVGPTQGEGPEETGLADEDYWALSSKDSRERNTHIERLIRVSGIVRLADQAAATKAREAAEFKALQAGEKALAERIWALAMVAQQGGRAGRAARRQAKWLLDLEAIAEAQDQVGGEAAVLRHIEFLSQVLDATSDVLVTGPNRSDAY